MSTVTITPASTLIYSKLIEVMKEIGVVGKNQKNTQQGYSFRGIDDLINAVHPALIKAGVIMVPEVLEKSEEVREVVRSNGKVGYDKAVSLKVRYTFIAEDGSSVSAVIASEGLDSGDKATNKAMSAALKYALIQTLAVPTADMEDGDKESPSNEGSAKKSTKSISATVTSTSSFAAKGFGAKAIDTTTADISADAPIAEESAATTVTTTRSSFARRS